MRLENGDFVKVLEDNGCLTDGFFNKKGLYVYNGSVFTFYNQNTSYNPCNKILSYGTQKTSFSDGNSDFKILTSNGQTRLVGNYTQIIRTYPPFFLNNSRRSLPSDTQLNITFINLNIYGNTIHK